MSRNPNQENYGQAQRGQESLISRQRTPAPLPEVVQQYDARSQYTYPQQQRPATPSSVASTRQRPTTTTRSTGASCLRFNCSHDNRSCVLWTAGETTTTTEMPLNSRPATQSEPFQSSRPLSRFAGSSGTAGPPGMHRTMSGLSETSAGGLGGSTSMSRRPSQSGPAPGAELSIGSRLSEAPGAPRIAEMPSGAPQHRRRGSETSVRRASTGRRGSISRTQYEVGQETTVSPPMGTGDNRRTPRPGSSSSTGGGSITPSISRRNSEVGQQLQQPNKKK